MSAGILNFERTETGTFTPSGLVWACCGLLVVGVLTRAPTSVLWGIAIVVCVLGARIAAKDPFQALLLIPVTSLLGPAARFPSNAAASVNAGDLYLLAVVAVVAARFWLNDRPVIFGRQRTLISLAAIAFCISWLFSLDPISSTVSLVGVAQLGLVFLLTLNLTSQPSDVRPVILSWIWAVALSSVLVIAAYLRGMPLLLGVDQAFVEQFGDLLVTAKLFYRATFFVSGFVFPLVVTTLFALFFALTLQRLQDRLLMWAVIAIDFVAMALMGNKTAFIGFAFGGLLVVAFLLAQGRAWRRLFMVTLVVAIGLNVALAGLARLFPGDQFQLMLERAVSGESLNERFQVWRNVVDAVIAVPRILLVGLGPDVSVRSAYLPVVRSIQQSGGVEQGAVDSGYLYLLLNSGVFVFALTLAVLGRAVLFLGRQARRDSSGMHTLALVGLATWLLMAITQQHGIAKPMFLLAQLVALADPSRVERQQLELN